MPLINLFNPPQSEAQMLIWSFAHADQHLQIIDAVANQQGKVLTQYTLDPMPTFDLKSWLRRHQTMHNDMNAVFSAQGADLTDLNFEKQEELNAWVGIHAFEHLFMNNQLGL